MKSVLPEWLLIIIAVIVLAGIACLASLYSENVKRTKQELAEKYNISRPTLKKWIKYFQIDLKPEDWDSKRFLTSIEFAGLQTAFGCDYSYVLTKGQIAERAFSDYKTVSENVIRNLEKIGISREAWESCSCFPPVIGGRILEMLG